MPHYKGHVESTSSRLLKQWSLRKASEEGCRNILIISFIPVSSTLWISSMLYYLMFYLLHAPFQHLNSSSKISNDTKIVMHKILHSTKKQIRELLLCLYRKYCTGNSSDVGHSCSTLTFLCLACLPPHMAHALHYTWYSICPTLTQTRALTSTRSSSPTPSTVSIIELSIICFQLRMCLVFSYRSIRLQ